MKIFHSSIINSVFFISKENILNSLSNQLTAVQKRIAIFATVIFAALAVGCVVYSVSFKIKKFFYMPNINKMNLSDKDTYKKNVSINAVDDAMKFGRVNSRDFIDRCIKRGPQLEYLNLTNANLSSSEVDRIFRSCPNIKKFEWRNAPLNADFWIEKLTNLNSLESLDLTLNNSITDKQLLVLKNISSLKFLNLSGCPITDQGLEHLKTLSSLQSLKLIHCKQITDLGIEYLQNLNSLQCLVLTGCDQMTDAGLKHLMNISSLQFLVLSNCDNITDQGIEYLKALDALHYLDLVSCQKITEKGIEHLKNLPSLQVLILAGCVTLTDQALDHLRNFGPLKMLDLNSCWGMTHQGVQNFKMSRPLIAVSDR